MQLDPIKPTLKAPGTKCLKLKYDKLLSNFAFKFKLRRYTMVYDYTLKVKYAALTKVGQCRLTLSNPC